MSFLTRQFKAGNSHAVRIPAEMAYPEKTELLVERIGDKIIVSPLGETLEFLPDLLASIRPASGGEFVRPEVTHIERNWK
jgi:antitoxin VapB